MNYKEIIRLAFIGTGNIASQHIRYIKGFHDTKIVGLYDINSKVCRAKQREFGGEAYNSLDKMLDSSNPDAVFICIPPYAHGRAEIACVNRGIPFLVEKPLARDLATAHQIANKVESAGIITSVAYMNRYRLGVQKAKELLEKYQVTIIHGGWIIDTPDRNHPWLMQKELSGGQMVEQTTHLFDLVRYLCGEVSNVQCYGAKGFVPRSRTYETDDATGVLLKMKSGAIASILSSWSSGFDRGIYLTLSGPDISIKFNNLEHDTQIMTRDSSTPIHISGEKDIFAIEDCAFIEAVKNNNPISILSDYFDGVRSLEISIAANKSLEEGKPVQLIEEDTHATSS